MAVEKSTAINASDLDGYLTTADAAKYLTAETVMSALDIDALKEAIGVANTSAAKIVGAVTASGNGSQQIITLPALDYDYLEVVAWSNTGVPVGVSLNAYAVAEANVEPISTFVSKGVSQFHVPYKTVTSNGSYTHIVLTATTICQLNNSTLTISGVSVTYNIIQYKNP